MSDGWIEAEGMARLLGFSGASRGTEPIVPHLWDLLYLVPCLCWRINKVQRCVYLSSLLEKGSPYAQAVGPEQTGQDLILPWDFWPMVKTPHPRMDEDIRAGEGPF